MKKITAIAMSTSMMSLAPLLADDLRVAAFNVEFGKHATPEQIGDMFKAYKLDIITFNEAPNGDWTSKVGKVLGMEHVFVGKSSSANHKSKYKSNDKSNFKSNWGDPSRRR